MEQQAGFTQYPVRMTAVMVAVILLAFLGFSIAARWYLLPSRMDDVLMNASEGEIPERMTLVLQHSPTPYQKLAKWMASDRPAISLEASRRLHEQIKQWEQYPGIQIANDATQLAEALHKEMARYPDKVRDDVHQMAVRMAGWDMGGATQQEGAFLVAVERLMNRSAASKAASEPAASDAMLSDYLDQADTKEATYPRIEPIKHVNDVPLSSGLPWNQADLPTLPRVKSAASQIPLEPSVTTSADVNETLRANQRLSIGQPLKLPPLTSSPRHIDPGPKPLEELPNYGSLTTLEVIWKLHAQSARLVEHARNELTSRRFTAADLELAARVSHPEIAQRLQVVRELPLMQRDDRKTWLYYMTKDPDESVRYAAAAALITSSDPRLLRQLKAELTTDPSPRIQSLIKR